MNIDSDVSKKIIDCFTFYNELELLTYRLNILNDIVDYFVIVEATHTHIGKEKMLFFNENKHLFENFIHKIIHIIVDDFPYKQPNVNTHEENQWSNERFQRNQIKRGLDKLDLNDHDIITITDLDEIPDPNTLSKIKNNEINVEINSLQMDLYYYNLNSKISKLWYHAKIVTYQKYKDSTISCSDIRLSMNYPLINNGGWHLSYFGDSSFIKNKIENFGHQEFNSDFYTNKELIEKRIKNYEDLYERGNTISRIPIKNNNYLPPEYDKYLYKFIIE